jgi:hypothetical protein
MWSASHPPVLGDPARARTVLASGAGVVLLAAAVVGTVVASDAVAWPGAAPVVAQPAPVAQPVARAAAPAPPAAPGVMPTVSARATCTVLAVDAATGLRTISLTVDYTASGGAYRLDAGDGALHDGGSWTTSYTMSRTSPANPVRVPNVLASSAFTPSGSYLGVVSGPETTVSC